MRLNKNSLRCSNPYAYHTSKNKKRLKMIDFNYNSFIRGTGKDEKTKNESKIRRMKVQTHRS